METSIVVILREYCPMERVDIHGQMEQFTKVIGNEEK